MSGRNGGLQCSVNTFGKEQLLSTAESSIDHSHGKLQQQGDQYYCSHISHFKILHVLKESFLFNET